MAVLTTTLSAKKTIVSKANFKNFKNLKSYWHKRFAICAQELLIIAYFRLVQCKKKLQNT